MKMVEHAQIEPPSPTTWMLVIRGRPSESVVDADTERPALPDCAAEAVAASAGA